MAGKMHLSTQNKLRRVDYAVGGFAVRRFSGKSGLPFERMETKFGRQPRFSIELDGEEAAVLEELNAGERRAELDPKMTPMASFG